MQPYWHGATVGFDGEAEHDAGAWSIGRLWGAWRSRPGANETETPLLHASTVDCEGIGLEVEDDRREGRRRGQGDFARADYPMAIVIFRKGATCQRSRANASRGSVLLKIPKSPHPKMARKNIVRRFWIFALLLIATPSWADDDALSHIEDNCKAEWPSDYPMHECCIGRQVEALKNVEKIHNGQQNSDEKAILSLCLAKWGKKRLAPTGPWWNTATIGSTRRIRGSRPANHHSSRQRPAHPSHAALRRGQCPAHLNLLIKEPSNFYR